MNDNKSEISLGQALLLSLGVGLAYLFLVYRSSAVGLMTAMDHAFAHSPAFWSILIAVTCGNILWVAGIVARKFGLSGQGSRLRTLSDDLKPKSYFQGAFSFWGFMVGCGVGIAALCFIQLPLPETVLGYGSRLYAFFAAQFGVTSSMIWPKVSGLVRRVRGTSALQKELSAFPKEENAIVLGSINDDKPDLEASWISCDRRSLNAGVLITGSIGSGKTQGSVLPYFSQALRNLKPQPAVLALDPKRRFVQEAKEITAAMGLTEKTRVISLDGKQTFNPVYVEDILKCARFLDSAEMIRAAALNFSGGATDSPFWEISGFNLLKNTIVHCATVQGYFTLKMSTERWLKPHPWIWQKQCA